MAQNDPGDIYRQAFDTYGASPQALHWLNYQSQAIRLKRLVAGLDIEGRSILDAGCGLGDLLPYLYAKADNFNYLGVDADENFIAEANKRYAGHKFRVGDALNEKTRDEFDLILVSGALNHNTPGWLDMRKRIIKSLFEQSLEAFAFNMAGGFGDLPERKKIAYAPAQEILDFCLSLSGKVNIQDDYLPLDFTITMFK